MGLGEFDGKRQHFGRVGINDRPAHPGAFARGKGLPPLRGCLSTVADSRQSPLKNARKTTVSLRRGRGDESRAAGLVASSSTTVMERAMTSDPAAAPGESLIDY